jgi:hypothetical protein
MTCGLGIVLAPALLGGSILQLIMKAINIALNCNSKIPFPAMRAPRSSREYKLYCMETSLLQACCDTTCSTGYSLDVSKREAVNFSVWSNTFIVNSKSFRRCKNGHGERVWTFVEILLCEQTKVIEGAVLF